MDGDEKLICRKGGENRFSKDAEILEEDREMAELIREVIIVEGRDDIDAVQKAVSADIKAHTLATASARLLWIGSAGPTRPEALLF